MQSIKGLSNRALLVILDGFGLRDQIDNNAIANAKKPNLDKLFSIYPMAKIEAGGLKVGLPKGVVGNSEVGHMNLGAGRPVRQDLVRINEAIQNQSLEKMAGLKELVSKAKASSGRIHLMGLLSDGGVHSHIDHLKEIATILSRENGIELFYHAFMDGRDTAPRVGEKYIEAVQGWGTLKFASMQGRSIGMDRDRRWEKIENCYQMLTGKQGVNKIAPIEHLRKEYDEGRGDEFIHPSLFIEEGAMKSGDSLFFLNFRPDRAVQISQAFNLPNFSEFKRDFVPHHYLCMTPYIPDDMELPVLFDKEKVPGGMSEYLSELNKKQFKIAETEKYAHVTFFFNGGEKKPFPGEEHRLIPSPKDVTTYDQKPEMSADQVTDELLNALEQDFDFLLVNYANSDMVGHTGVYQAAVNAIETLDQCVGRLMTKCEELNITLVLTADHGNSDQMAYEDGTPHTSHTGSLVPFAVFHPKLIGEEVERNGKNHALMDVAPTLLHIMGIEQPPLFSGGPIFK